MTDTKQSELDVLKRRISAEVLSLAIVVKANSEIDRDDINDTVTDIIQDLTTYLHREQLCLIERIESEVINKARDIFLTNEMVAKGDYGDVVAMHWDSLRKMQRQSLATLKNELKEGEK